MLPLFALVFGTRLAHAEPELLVELDYRPDAELEGCPTDAAFRAMIQGELGYDPFRVGAEQKVVARARVAEPGLQGFVEWYDAAGTPRGQRELRAKTRDCAALAREMSFAIAVQIQLLAREPQPPDEPPATAPVDEPPAGPVSPPAKVSERPSDTRPAETSRPNETAAHLRFALGAGPAVAFGLAPRTAFEGRAFVGARIAQFAAEVGFEGSLPARYETADGQGFEQRVLAGSAAGCAWFGKVSGCVVTKVGSLVVRGFGVDVPNSDSGVIAQLGPRVALGDDWGKRWFGALRVEALATLVSWEVTLNQQEVWKTPLFSLSVGGDLGFFLQ